MNLLSKTPAIRNLTSSNLLHQAKVLSSVVVFSSQDQYAMFNANSLLLRPLLQSQTHCQLYPRRFFFFSRKNEQQPNNHLKEVPAKRHNSTTTSQSSSSSSSTKSTKSTKSTTITKRPFQILGLQQVAVGSTDLASLRTFWMDILGLTKINTHTSEKENVMEDILIIGNSASSSSSSSSSSSISSNGYRENNKTKNYVPPVELDLMCPIDENKSPKVHKPPLNHIGLWIDDLPKAVEWMKSKGVRFTPGGIRKGAAGYDVTFIHPKGSDESPIAGCGVLIELVQAPTSVIKALKR